MSGALGNGKLRRAWLVLALALAVGALMLLTYAVLDALHARQLHAALLTLRDPVNALRADELLQQQQQKRGLGGPLPLLALVLLGLAAFSASRARRAAQSALPHDSAQFEGLFDTLPQLVWMCDAAGRALYLNQRWADYSGLPLHQLLQDGWFQLVHPDDLAFTKEGWRVATPSDATSMSQFRLRRVDGSYRWFSASFSASRDEQGRLRHWFGSSTDIEDARQARLALERSEQFSRGTLNSLSEGVITFDGTGPLMDCNASAERVLGVPRAVMLSRPVHEWGLLLQREDGQAMDWDDTPVNAVFNTGRPCRDVLLRAIAPDGQLRWLHANAEPMLSANSRTLIAVVISFHDVTERVQARLELARHRDQLEAVVAERTQQLTATLQARLLAEQQTRLLHDQLHEAERFSRLVADKVRSRITYWDKDQICRFVNQAACEHFGKSAEQLLGHSMRELRGDAYFEHAKPRALAALAGQVQDFDRLEHNAAGEPVDMQVQYFPDIRGGEVKGFVVLVTHIGRHKQAEQMLRLANEQLAEARDRATAANQAKSAFLANMSHEIRTPLNAIVGFAQVLLGEVQDPSQRQQLEHISTAAYHLLQVINDILDLSRIEAGQLVLEAVDFSLDALLARTCALVQEPVRDKGLALRLDIAPLPQRLRGDPTRLTQALLNLLSNAVAFTDQGTVTLHAAVAARDDNGVLLRFEVVDTGQGVAPQELARLFNPFAQAERNSTRMHGGSGLGLAITRHIALQMGGDAGGASQLGAGSRFWFTARLDTPRQLDTPAPALPHSSMAATLAGARVLLVEDNPVNQEVAKHLLRAAALVVDVAGDGQQALEMLRRQAYDLVLMDVQMPRMDGLQATRLLRQDPQLRHLPVVALTANAMPQDRQDCLDAGMNDHLAKPVDAPLLYAALARWLPARPQLHGGAETLQAPAPGALVPRSPDQQLAGLAAVVDLQQARAYCGGDSRVMLNVMARFVEHYRATGAALLAHLQAGDVQAVARLLHSLRGASASVGASKVLALAQHMEAAIQQEQDFAALLSCGQALAGALDGLVAAMAQQLAD